MNFTYAGLTDKGLLRENNEDALAIDPLQSIAVLADGMGGYNAGEIASAMAVTFVKAELSRWLQETAMRSRTRDIRQAIEACVINANQSIYNAAKANPHFSGMGTTLVVGVFDQSRVLVANVGDSRCYMWRDHVLTQLTRDHSLLQEQLDAGLLTAEQAKVATHKNLVTRALGVEPGVLVDVFEHVPMPGDVYLMCSDGLCDMVDDEDMAQILSDSGSLTDQAHALIRAANDAGGRDNISVILASTRTEPGKPGFFSRILRRS